ncbi:MAG TPA: hypothetical protein VMV77_04605 [Bacteroidales bacterium]|nr:hypothetical protein [Bacteroidales bacterium]
MERDTKKQIETVNKAVPISIDHKEVFANYDKQMGAFNNEIQEMIAEFSHKINYEKERLLTERIKILFNEDIDLITETQRIFPRITAKRSDIDKSEAFFWNDGTNFGKLIITFYPFENFPELSSDPLSVKITYGFKYK